MTRGRGDDRERTKPVETEYNCAVGSALLGSLGLFLMHEGNAPVYAATKWVTL
jgi:hypothetical protein